LSPGFTCFSATAYGCTLNSLVVDLPSPFRVGESNYREGKAVKLVLGCCAVSQLLVLCYSRVLLEALQACCKDVTGENSR